jgi:hypothetical protein
MTTDDAPLRSCLYLGHVMHKRLRPFRHRFVHRVFSLYVDLDELPQLSRCLRIFSHNRWNIVSFFDRDHGARDGTPLRPWIESELAAAGIVGPFGSIRLLCFPRLFGYVFNPLSLWFCHESGGRLVAVLYEVSNTFSQHHGYLIPVEATAPGSPIEQGCEKRFHVSPFIPMQARYRFRLQEPADRLAIAISETVAAGPILVATQTGRRVALSGRRLAAALLGHPCMTLKITAAIHWHALRLWLKGAKIQRRPAPPPVAVTRLCGQFIRAAE